MPEKYFQISRKGDYIYCTLFEHEMGKITKKCIEVAYEVDYAQDLILKLEASRQNADKFGALFIGMVLGSNKQLWDDTINALKHGVDLILENA